MLLGRCNAWMVVVVDCPSRSAVSEGRLLYVMIKNISIFSVCVFCTSFLMSMPIEMECTWAFLFHALATRPQNPFYVCLRIRSTIHCYSVLANWNNPRWEEFKMGWFSTWYSWMSKNRFLNPYCAIYHIMWLLSIPSSIQTSCGPAPLRIPALNQQAKVLLAMMSTFVPDARTRSSYVCCVSLQEIRPYHC